MNNIKTNTLFFTLLALIFGAFVALSFIDPPDLIQWLVQSYGLDVKKGKLLAFYIHQMTWIKLKVALVCVSVFMLYLFYSDKNMLKEYRLSFLSFYGWVKRDLFALTRNERLVIAALLGMFIGTLVYYSSITPIQLDELHTWLFFIQRGPLITAAYYPASNNHIAYNLLSIPWALILSPIWALRMVSLLSAVATVFLFLLILKQRYNFLLSIVGMLMLMSSTCFAWYAIQGRGYVLELFFLITILYILIRTPSNFCTDRLIVLGNAVAMYCVPIAIIPLVVLNGFYIYEVFKSDPPNLKRIIKTAIYSIALIVLCYLPVGIFSGFEQLINNPFAQHIAYHDAFVVGWTTYLPAIWDFISGSDRLISISLVLCLLVGTILLCFRDRSVLVYPILFLLPFILLQVYPVLLFERTWLWLVIPFVCWCIEVTFAFTRQRKMMGAIAATFFILTIVTVNMYRSYTSNQLLVKSAERFLAMRQAIETQMLGKIISVDDDVVYNYLLFFQGVTKNYTLLYGALPPTVKADAMVNNWQRFSADKGKVIWTDSVYVLYIPE